MGYSTEFVGAFTVTPPLSAEHGAKLLRLWDPGSYLDHFREGDDLGPVLDDLSGIRAPSGYCQWRPTEDGSRIEWDQGEKFYEYTPWLTLISTHLLEPWGYVLSGAVEWSGEDPEDQGVIHARNNQIQAIPNVITKPDPAWKVSKPEPIWEEK